MKKVKTEAAKEAGRRYYLKNKEKVKAAAVLWKKNNKEKVAVGAKIYRELNKDFLKSLQDAWILKNRDRVNATAKKYADKNKEKINARAKKYRIENLEKINLRVAAYRKTEKYKAINQNNLVKRRTRLACNEKLSTQLVSKLLTLQNGKCVCCGEPLGKDYHLDHIMPLALGGKNIDANIQLLRRVCNLNKHAKHPIDFMQERGFLL